MTENITYASADDVLRTLGLNPATLADHVRTRAESRAEAATAEWIRETGRPFHDRRVGDADEPATWEVYDLRDVRRGHPLVIPLQNRHILPLDSSEGDAIEIRLARDRWRDIIDSDGDEWTLDNRIGRVLIYRELFRRVRLDDPRMRFLRVTYRHGPLGDDVEMDGNLVTSVPPDVKGAVASRAAMGIAIDDDQGTGVPDDGQLTSRGSRRAALKETWDETVARYQSFSVV